jgi:hypothetical protein
MKELAKDGMLLGAILLGAVLQKTPGGGPWLLLAGTAGMGFRVFLPGDDRRGLWSVIAGWFAPTSHRRYWLSPR